MVSSKDLKSPDSPSSINLCTPSRELARSLAESSKNFEVINTFAPQSLTIYSTSFA